MRAVSFEEGVRIVILVLATAVAVTGILLMVGYLVREGMDSHLRIALGAVVFLYGAYKFTVTFFRRPGKKEP